MSVSYVFGRFSISSFNDSDRIQDVNLGFSPSIVIFFATNLIMRDVPLTYTPLYANQGIRIISKYHTDGDSDITENGFHVVFSPNSSGNIGYFAIR